MPFPMLSDIKHDLCGQLGILDENAGVAQRATFLVDPDNRRAVDFAARASVLESVAGERNWKLVAEAWPDEPFVQAVLAQSGGITTSQSSKS